MRMAGAEGSAGRQAELEPVVSLVDVLEEDEELENEACAVLGGSDSEKCSYSQVGARPGPRLPRAPADLLFPAGPARSPLPRGREPGSSAGPARPAPSVSPSRPGRCGAVRLPRARQMLRSCGSCCCGSPPALSP